MEDESDFCLSAEYADLIASFQAGEHSALDVGDAMAAREEWYHAYTWYLIGEDLGEDEADDRIEGMQTAELVCDEDGYLAELQVALWWHRGIVIPADVRRAAKHLANAALPFLGLPFASEFAAAPDPEAFREKVWDEALERFGIPKDEASIDAAAAGEILDRVLVRAQWPGTLDFSIPLGPSLPDRPHFLHTRHLLTGGARPI